MHVYEARADYRTFHINHPADLHLGGVSLEDRNYIFGDTQTGSEPSLTSTVYNSAIL